MPARTVKTRRVTPLLLGAIALVALVAARAQAGGTIVSRVDYETADGVYIDVGSEQGVYVGQRGIIERDGVEIARIEVVTVARRSALVRVLSRRVAEVFMPDDRVRLYVEDEVRPPPAGAEQSEGLAPPPEEGQRTRRRLFPPPREETRRRRSLFPPPRDGRVSTSSTLRDPGAEEEEFVPLLTPRIESPVGLPSNENILSGRIRLRQSYQLDHDDRDRNFGISRIGSDGSLDRIAGTRWAFEWGGQASYRFGEGLRNNDDFEEVRLDLYLLSFFRAFEDDDGFVRIGRFLPRELPAAGYFDGAQAEMQLTEGFIVGLIGGLKPTRDRLEPTLDEPAVAPYVTIELGERPVLYYTGTFGVLGSFFQGDPDRLALLVDQRLEVSKDLSFFSTAEVDFDIGGAIEKDGADLTRLDFYGNWRVFEWLTLRAGVDHFERPDTAAERDLVGDPTFFDEGTWRYWAGATQYLPFDLRADEEVAFTEVLGDDAGDDFLRWRVSLSRRGLPFFDNALLTLTAFNIQVRDDEGYGGLVTLYLPFLDGRLSFRTTATARHFEDTDVPDQEGFNLTSVQAALDWRIGDHLILYLSGLHSFSDQGDTTFLELGLDFRF